MVLSFNSLLLLVNKKRAAVDFGLSKLKEGSDMTFGNYESVQRGNWITVWDCVSQLVLGKDSFAVNPAE